MVETGIDILVSDMGKSRRRIPDLAFGKLVADGDATFPEYGIIVECGYSQSPLSLHDKAKLWFTVPTVETVITIKFVCAEFANPNRKSGRSSPVDRATFSEDWVPGLGGIVYDDHTWAPAVETIMVDIYIRDPNTKEPIHDSWDVTPDASELDESQNEIMKLIHRMTRHFVGLPAFQAIYPRKKNFVIDWQKFYRALHLHLLSDAYKRYVTWVDETTCIVAPSVTEERRNMLKRTPHGYGTDSDDETDEDDEVEDGPPSKRQNQSTSL
ncbi:hypothetical protein C8J57DRAFT_1523335 [Mycena rebaudengoi]|nr:hypothetical protein C8J57DRAFT_1523335 [Mycena rebaudengoi]